MNSHSTVEPGVPPSETWPTLAWVFLYTSLASIFATNIAWISGTVHLRRQASSTVLVIGKGQSFAYYVTAVVLEVQKNSTFTAASVSLFSIHEIPRIACCPVIRTGDSPPLARFPGSCIAIFFNWSTWLNQDWSSSSYQSSYKVPKTSRILNGHCKWICVWIKY